MIRPPLAVLATATLLVCAACDSRPTQPLVPDPSLAISDGSHEGNDHFFWLPPIAPGGSYGGTFIGTLSPVVRICDWLATDECGTTVLEFGRTFGPAAHRVGVDVHGQHYHLNLDVSAFPQLTAGTTYRISVFFGDTDLGFADVQMASNGQSFKDLKTQEIIGLTDGRTFPIKFRIEKELLDYGLFTLAFHTQRDGDYEVYLSDASGHALVNVSNDPGVDGTPTWSPDGQMLAFMSDRHDPGGTPDIYVMNVDGTGVRRVTYGGGWKPAWSPDGSTIAFQRGWPPESRNQDIWIVDPVTGAETQLTDADCPAGLDHWEDIDPTWDPTGLVTFARGDNETPLCGTGSNFPVTSFDIVVRVPWDPDVLRNLTRNPDVDQMTPAWSHDGAWLVFAQRTGDVASDLWLQPRFAAPGYPMGLTTTPGWINQEPDWAPDDASILFTRGATEESLGLWVLTLDGAKSPTGMTELIPDAGWGRFRPGTD